MNNGKAGKRGKIGGWTAQSSRRNMRFLWSIDTDRLTGTGYSFTLTVPICPATPRDWADWCATYWKRLEQAGAIRIHWVIEWQRRGCPHLHGSVYFDESADLTDIQGYLIHLWVYRNPFSSAAHMTAQQRCLRIFDAVGWGQYVAKHAARGVKHYQRSPENIPAAWQGVTGRIWGSRGDWPVTAPLRIELQDKRGDGGWYAYRRLVRSYGVSKARLTGDRAAQIYARRMLRSNDRKLAECRGLSSWAPRNVIEQLMENLDNRGFSVKSVQPEQEGDGGENGLSSPTEANGFLPHRLFRYVQLGPTQQELWTNH